VSAARALGARLVIAVNLNSDMLGRGLTISSHGSDDNDRRLREELAKQPGGLRGLFGSERSLRRQFLGNAERPGLPTVMVDAFNIMQDRVTRARLAGDPPDVMISPRIGHIGLFDFHRAQEAIELGARTTQRTLDLVDEALAALAASGG
jgi:NTE family protein